MWVRSHPSLSATTTTLILKTETILSHFSFHPDEFSSSCCSLFIWPTSGYHLSVRARLLFGDPSSSADSDRQSHWTIDLVRGDHLQIDRYLKLHRLQWLCLWRSSVWYCADQLNLAGCLFVTTQSSLSLGTCESIYCKLVIGVESLIGDL